MLNRVYLISISALAILHTSSCGRPGADIPESRIHAASVTTEESGKQWTSVTYTDFRGNPTLRWGHEYGEPAPGGGWMVRAKPYEIAVQDKFALHASGYRAADGYTGRGALTFGPYLHFQHIKQYYLVDFFIEVSLSEASTTVRDGQTRHAWYDVAGGGAAEAFRVDLSSYSGWNYRERHALSTLGLDWNDQARRRVEMQLTIGTPEPKDSAREVEFRIWDVHPVLNVIVKKIKVSYRRGLQ